MNIDLGKWPNVKAYVDRVAARPKVQEAMKAEGSPMKKLGLSLAMCAALALVAVPVMTSPADAKNHKSSSKKSKAAKVEVSKKSSGPCRHRSPISTAALPQVRATASS